MQPNSQAEREARNERDDLCDQIFGRITLKLGNELRLDIEPEPLRTVSAVWHSMGIILNGGFAYLFEGSFRGDEDFAKTRLSFARIGATKAVEAFDLAFACFPNGKLPTDASKRTTIYRAQDPKMIEAIDNCFFDGEEEIRDRLAAFISREAEPIEKLLGDEFNQIAVTAEVDGR